MHKVMVYVHTDSPGVSGLRHKKVLRRSSREEKRIERDSSPKTVVTQDGGHKG